MLQTSNIDDHLADIVPLLTELVHSDSPAWTVEQAVGFCRSGEWLLLTDTEDTGFCMVSVEQCRFSGQRLLRIEAFCHPGRVRDIAHYQQFLDVLARRLRCGRIVMEAKRRGWERLGWRPEFITYTRPVRDTGGSL
jgi:hypothetical protein